MHFTTVLITVRITTYLVKTITFLETMKVVKRAATWFHGRVRVVKRRRRQRRKDLRQRMRSERRG